MTEPHAAAPRLHLDRISKAYGGVQAVADVSVSVQPGQVLALCGENGAGKSTLAKIIGGEIAPDLGAISLDGALVRLTDPATARKLGVAVIAQELNYVPTLTVAENVLLGGLPRRGPIVDWSLVHARARQALAALAPDLDTRRLISTLPVAERQIVEIARALSVQSRVIVMDEPTAALNHQDTERLFRLVRQLASTGVAFIYISHRLDEVFSLADHIAVLRDGRLVSDNPTAATNRARVIKEMVGRDIQDLYPRRASTIGAPRLVVSNLSRGAALRGADFTVHAGEIVGVFGLLGSGTDTLVKTLFGALRADEGEIAVDGVSIGRPTPTRARRAGIALVPGERKEEGLVLGLGVRENLGLSTLPALKKFGVVDRRLERARAIDAVQSLRIRMPSLEAPVGRLSGGNQQKVVIGRWLQARPRVFVLEEPTRGVDVGAKVEVYRLMERLAEEGAAILLVSSEMPEVLSMSDRILVMCEGRIAAEYPRGAATQEVVLDSAIGRAAS